MAHSTAELVAQVERLGGCVPPGHVSLAQAVWPAGWVYRLGPEFLFDPLTLGVPSTPPDLEEFPGAVCFGQNADGDLHLLLLPDGSACTLDTSFGGRAASTPESAVALLARLEVDVATSVGLAVPAREGRVYRTFNRSLVLAIDGGRRAAVLTGGHGTGLPVPGHAPGEVYEFASDGVFEALGAGDQATEFRLSNALSLAEELPTDLTVAKPPAPPGDPGESLAPEVVRQVRRLGGFLPPPPAPPSPCRWGEYAVPEPLRRFLWDVAWPPGWAFENGEDDDPRVWWYVPGAVEVDPNSAFRRLHPQAVGIGTADGGNYTLVTVLDCPDPADPPVFRLDHDEADRMPTRSVPLSRFLASLKPDPRYNRAPVPPLPGRLYRVGDGGVALVRTCDDRGAVVVMLLVGQGVTRDVPGRYAGEAYRVDARGVYDGPHAADVRSQLSLTELISFDPGDPQQGSVCPTD